MGTTGGGWVTRGRANRWVGGPFGKIYNNSLGNSHDIYKFFETDALSVVPDNRPINCRHLPPTGLEPEYPGFAARCSTTELRHWQWILIWYNQYNRLQIKIIAYFIKLSVVGNHATDYNNCHMLLHWFVNLKIFPKCINAPSKDRPCSESNRETYFRKGITLPLSHTLDNWANV